MVLVYPTFASPYLDLSADSPLSHILLLLFLTFLPFLLSQSLSFVSDILPRLFKYLLRVHKDMGREALGDDDRPLEHLIIDR